MSRPLTLWKNKFAAAWAGLSGSIREQNSFHVHGVLTIAVLAVASMLRLEPWRWSVLLITIAVVWTTELLNTALEQLVQVVHPEYDPRIGKALDAAAAAVLVAAIASVAIGLVVLGPPLWQALAPH